MTRALPSGTRFAGFELQRVLGAGGFGITYLVRDIKTRTSYAMKEYFPTDIAERDGLSVRIAPVHQSRFSLGLEAFFQEAEILRSLPAIPGLIVVRGLFRRNGTAYVVMEFVDGKKLSDLLQGYLDAGRPVPEAPIRNLLVSISRALDTVHQAKLIHRDIKPDNIMVRERDGQAILIDFGAARHLRNESENAIYTPSFAALEQIPPPLRRQHGHCKEGPWTDFFALSMVAYVMMTGRKASSAEARAAALAAGEPDPYVPVARAGGGSYSAELCDLVDFGCTLEPLKRPATAREFLACIGKSTSGATDRGAARRNGLPRTSSIAPKARNAFILMGIAALLIGAIWAGLS
ncbi:serine/threonine protein kinase [Rhodobacter maris]|uniref:non-specific serine/threonine protein kinase n=1 Tax=Rhodobacter maris TaxID=446682 RepID=A0A285TI22_9RHOB|nr:serine/threonine-protein kinase [Rhodobacter maris]SOC21388.1 serine/threonine protein kinase [Rhodobacter maris]